MHVGGTATKPVIVGDLSVLRGTYSFAGRRFELANSSKVTFDGGDMFNPQLAISASTTVESVTATINIGGRALAPQITFVSTPNLPQDEVLSRLLFGTSVTSLSPTQAIQLAAALNSLRGSGGGGLNPLGKLRSATGIDRLRVLGADKTAGRGTALAAGQYISNDIYVEVITDARGFTATQLQIALSKTLSLLSQTSSFGGSSVNLRYSKDY
jgi:translocation and assembly module TamB